MVQLEERGCACQQFFSAPCLSLLANEATSTSLRMMAALMGTMDVYSRYNVDIIKLGSSHHSQDGVCSCELKFVRSNKCYCVDAKDNSLSRASRSLTVFSNVRPCVRLAERRISSTEGMSPPPSGPVSCPASRYT